MNVLAKPPKMILSGWSCACHRTRLPRKPTQRDDPGRTARNAMILEELLGTVVGDTTNNLV